MGAKTYVCIYICKVICNVREIGKFRSQGIIYEFIGNLNIITVSRLINESASDSLN